MARKKRRKRIRLTKQLQFELLGILFVFLSIFGSGASIISDGFIPTSLENIFRFFLGIWYFVFPVVLLIIGVYLVIKRKLPKFLTKRATGFIILFFGILLLTHIQTFETLLIHASDTSILKMTWSHFVSFTQGQGVTKQLGGGMIGGVLFATSYYLFSAAGAKIVAVFSMVIGILFFTNFSIGNGYVKIKQLLKKIQTASKKNKQEARKEKQKRTQPAAQTMQVEQAEELGTPEMPPIPNELDVQYTYKETKSGQLEIDMEDEPIEELPMEELKFNKHEQEPYHLPPIQLLNEPITQSQQREKSQIKKTVQLLEATFK